MQYPHYAGETNLLPQMSFLQLKVSVLTASRKSSCNFHMTLFLLKYDFELWIGVKWCFCSFDMQSMYWPVTMVMLWLQGMEDKSQRNVILVNASKRELFTLNNGLKSLNRKLRSSWKLVPYVAHWTNSLILLWHKQNNLHWIDMSD